MNSLKKIIASLVTLSLLSGCGVLKASPAPDSGFLGNAGKQASQNENFPFHRVWSAEPSEKVFSNFSSISIAEVDLSHLNGQQSLLSEQPAEVNQSTLDQKDAQEIALYTRSAFERYLTPLHPEVAEGVPSGSESLPEELVLELALVELKPTQVARNVAGTVLGAFIPGASVVSIGSQGTVAIEGRLKQQRTGKVLFTFADRESGKLAPVNFNDWRLFSHARDIIDDWAKQWAEIVSNEGKKKVADSLPVTLLPI